MTKEKTARLIPNAIQVSTDTEKVTRESATQWLAVKLHHEVESVDKSNPRTQAQTCLTKPFISALLHLVRGQGPDLHDDVPAVAERPAGQGERIHS